MSAHLLLLSVSNTIIWFYLKKLLFNYYGSNKKNYYYN